MKKISIIAISLAVLFPSCEKSGETTLPDVSQEGITVIPADLESLLLGDDERVWPEGAYLGVFGSEKGTNEKYVLKKAFEGLASAEFYGPLVAGETISAYYPWNDSYTGRATAMPVALSSGQAYSELPAKDIFQQYCTMAFATMRAGRMRFFYPFGMLRLKVELDSALNVKEIVFSSSSRAAAGMGEVLPDGSLKMSGGASGVVTLDCGEGIPTEEGGVFHYYYLTLLPGDYPDAKLVIKAEGEDPIVCVLDGISIPRIDASAFTLASVVVSTEGPSGFVVNEQQFD